MKNLGWLYYKDYFREVDFREILDDKSDSGSEIAERNAEKEKKQVLTGKNQAILEWKFDSNLWFEDMMPKMGKDCIKAKVCYPGLVTGVGLGHEAKIEEEFKLGMHFDYTYGMPVIYGSSVKGLLRSMFKYPEYIQEKMKGLSEKEVWELEKNIFDGVGSDGLLSIYERDIFYDAVIVKANKQGRILEQDVLAPHGKDPLKNPQPFMFLKIASGVTMEFCFDLKDFAKIKVEQKLGLFKEILGDIGIGAKTNVGYGQLEILKQNS